MTGPRISESPPGEDVCYVCCRRGAELYIWAYPNTLIGRGRAVISMASMALRPDLSLTLADVKKMRGEMRYMAKQEGKG